MKLYLIRHGESENNIKKVYTGWMDVSLTEKGFADARGIRPLLERVRFDKIYTSDLLRAKQTAQTAIPDCVCEETPLLREINVGDAAGVHYSKITVQNHDFTPYHGENDVAFYARVKQFMDKALQSGAENVAAFTHAGVLRAVLCTVLQAKIAGANFFCGNCTTAIFDYTDGKWRLQSWITP